MITIRLHGSFFDKKVDISAGIRRKKRLRLLAYLATARALDLPQSLMIIRALRVLVIPRHCTELQKFASAD